MIRSKFFFENYILTFLCGVTIIVLCLFWVPPHSEKLDEIPFIDKWVHWLMYAGFTAVLGWERSRKGIMASSWYVNVLVVLSLYGGLIEICQGMFTATRSAEWMDFFADAFGVCIGLVIVRWGILPLRRKMDK